MTTAQLLEALMRHYRKPGGARDGEVLVTEAAAPNNSGRRADLVRIGLWASREPGIDVHELKVSTADWRKELDDPAKAEAWWPHCHRFWIVAPSVDIVDPATVPDGWGLLIPSRGRRFKPVVKAAMKEPRITTRLMVELIRRTDNIRLNEIDRLRDKHRAEKYRIESEAVTAAARRGLPHDVHDRLQALDEFEAVLGVALDRYAWKSGHANPAQLAAAIKGSAAGLLAVERAREQAESALTQAERALSRVREARERLPAPLEGSR